MKTLTVFKKNVNTKTKEQENKKNTQTGVFLFNVLLFQVIVLRRLLFLYVLVPLCRDNVL